MNASRFSLAVALACLFTSAPARAGGQDIPYRVVQQRWRPLLGNHRAVVRVEGKADAVWAHLPWRRHDLHPEQKDVVVVDAVTGQEVKN